MDVSPHSAASHHLPFYLPDADGSDPVLVGTGIFLIVAVMAFGLLFLRLHTLPERLAHGGQKLQFEIVAVLGLLALFTHMHVFWVAGLLLALVDLPDLTGPMRRIAGSAEKVAGLPPGGGDTAPAIRPAPHAAPEARSHAPAAPQNMPPAPAPMRKGREA
ncbi:hypothetical protein ACFOD4_09700 [Pseudoroseomonas globiformis]|uniref:Uncharacterized protein n=1 Tax=Teichococcus globiformis TaxID=2307229 RepID=A0ABV7G520_9PROT